MAPAPVTPWFFESWTLIEWVITTTGAGAIAAVGFVWRLISRIDRLDADLLAAQATIRERHEENVAGRNDLLREIRHLRQSIESLHRDLNARVDKLFITR